MEKVSILKLLQYSVKFMPRKSREQLFGVFDDQAISILAVLNEGRAKFSELLVQTSLPKASLFRVIQRLERGGIVRKTANGYKETDRGRRVMELVSRIAREERHARAAKVGRRMSQLEREYLADHRIFHSDAKWERTAEKPLLEVMAMRGMTGTESLLFHQRFQEEVVREEQRLRRSKGKA